MLGLFLTFLHLIGGQPNERSAFFPGAFLGANDAAFVLVNPVDDNRVSGVIAAT